MAIVNYKTDYPLCILINNKEINKDYFIDKGFYSFQSVILRQRK